jgi:hypothetical protein
MAAIGGNGVAGADRFLNPFQLYFAGLDTMAQGMGPMKAVARCQLEAMGLVSRRAQAYMEWPSRLSRCRTPQDLMSEQVRFAQIAFQQYQDTSMKMMAAWSSMVPAMGAAGAQRVERDYISFGDPREANGVSRTARDRYAA